MQAVVVDHWLKGPDEVQLSVAPVPEPSRGQVLVDVAFAGANFYDILMVQGKYQFRPSFPFIPGTEFSGVISKLGPGVTEWKVGQLVYGITMVGAYAEKVAVPAKKIRAIPKGMSLTDAAGFSMTYPTSYAALVYRAQLRKGETLLVHAAAGGVGIAAVQIGKALGARVIGTVGSAEKVHVAKEAGCDEVINYKEEDFVEKVKELTHGKGADVIYDPVGGEVFDKSTKVVSWGGRILVVGFAGGKIPTLQTNRVLLKNCSVVGVFWGSYEVHQPQKVDETLHALEEMYTQGHLKPVTCAVYPLAELSKGLKHIGSRQSYGKVIIKIKDQANTTAKL
jgi:NADPH2:quinone reductase